MLWQVLLRPEVQVVEQVVAQVVGRSRQLQHREGGSAHVSAPASYRCKSIPYRGRE